MNCKVNYLLKIAFIQMKYVDSILTLTINITPEILNVVWIKPTFSCGEVEFGHWSPLVLVFDLHCGFVVCGWLQADDGVSEAVLNALCCGSLRWLGDVNPVRLARRRGIIGLGGKKRN